METIQSLRELIKNQDVLKGVQNLLSENQTLSKQVAKMTQAQAGNIKGEFAESDGNNQWRKLHCGSSRFRC